MKMNLELSVVNSIMQIHWQPVIDYCQSYYYNTWS